MPNNNNRINFQVGYNVDQASVNAVKKSLQDLQNIKFKDFKGPRLDLELIKRVAGQVLSALTKAFNVNLNSLNTQQFNASLKQALLSIDGIYNSFSKAGAQGQVAFSRMASEVLTTNMQLKLTNSLISQMGETMANTVKWGIASSVMNNFTNSVRLAFDYVKALDSSLNDIRIVTKQSSDLMANFAVQANNSAQALGRSTMDYTKAALTFYQQGLDEASVQARTESVLKAQNITGAGLEMADYLTAVWNGYKVANEEAELYVDKLAAVADSSASNMSLLAIAMSKVASAANLLGVPVDSLNAQIATIVATTRQAPLSVGNALKTIYSRINDIATGADDALISLGNYSKKMALVGISVLDANGRLRDTGDVIDEIGGKWETLSHEQQIYLARTMAGQRQYNNLLALFENWGKYSDLVNVSMEAQGATALKNAIYMESLSAKMEQLGAAGERVKSALIDKDDLKGLVDFGTGAVNLFGSLIESIGGGKNAILSFGTIFAQVFSGTITKEINNAITNFQNFKNNNLLKQADIENTKLYGASKGYKDDTISAMVNAKKAAQDYYDFMLPAQINEYNQYVKNIGQIKLKILVLLELKNKYLSLLKIIQRRKGLSLLDASLYIDSITDTIEKQQSVIKTTQKTLVDYSGSIKKLFGRNLVDSISSSMTKVRASMTAEGFLKFGGKDLLDKAEKIKALGLSSNYSITKIKSLANEYQNWLSVARQDVKIGLNINLINAELQQLQNQMKMASQEADRFLNGVKQFASIKTFVNVAVGASQAITGISNLINLTKVWQDNSVSAGEKIKQTFTNIGMSLPLLINGVSTVIKNFKGFTSAIQLATLARQIDVTALKEQIIQLQILAGVSYEQAAATAAKTISLKAHAITLHEVALAYKDVIVSAMPYIALAAGIAAAIYGLYKAWNQASDAAEKAALKTKKAQENYNNLKESSNNLKTSLDGLASATDHFNELTKGTLLWRTALQEVNDQVLSLMQEFPELRDYVESTSEGLLYITEEGQNTVQLTYRKRNIASGLAYANADRISTEAQNYSLITNASRDLDGSGGLTPDLLKEVVDAVNQHGEYVLKNTEWLDKNTDLSSKDIQVVELNTGKISELAKLVNANTVASLHLTNAILRPELADNSLYQNSSNQDAFVRLVLNSLKNVKLDDSYYSDIGVDTQGNLTYRHLDLKGLAQAWAEDLGKTFGLDIRVYGVGAWKKIQQKVDGDWKDVLLDLIADAVAYQDAVDDIDSIYLQVNQQILSLGEKSSSILAAFSDSLEDFDFSKFSISDIKQALNDEELINTIADSFQVNPELVLRKLKDSYQDMWNSYLSYLLELPLSVKQGLEEYILSQPAESMSELMKEAIGNMLHTSFSKGLDEFENTSNILKGIDVLEIFPFQLIVDSFTGTDVSLDEFKEALSLAGIVLEDVSDDLLQKFIDQIKGIGLAINPELIYKNIHDVIDKIETGDTITAELASNLENAGVSLNGFFTHMADGSYKLEADALEFYNYANNQSLLGFKQQIESLKEGLGERIQFETESQYSASNNGDFKAFSSNAGQDILLLAEQLNFLEAIGVKDDDIRLIERDISKGRLLDAGQVKKVAKLVLENKELWSKNKDTIDENVLQIGEYNKQINNALLTVRLFLKTLDPDINKDEWKNLTEYLNLYGLLLEEVSEDVLLYKENAELLAEAMLRYDHALELVASHYNEWLAALTSGSAQDAALAANELQNVYSDLLDLPYLNLSPDFTQSIDNLHLLQEAANGSEEAYNQLMQAAQQDILAQAHISIDDTDFWNAKTEVLSAMLQMNFQDIEVGASLNDEGFLQSLTLMVNAAGMTAEQATDYLSSMGIDAKVVLHDTTTQLNQEQIGYRPVGTGPATFTQDVTYFGPNGQLINGTVHYAAQGYSYEPITVPTSATKENKAFSLEVTSAGKKSGGGFKYNNASHGGGSKAPRSSGGGGGGGGSKPKAASVKSITNAAKVDTTVKKTTVKAPTPEKLDDTKIKEKLIEETILFLKTEELELLEVEEERADVYHDINILLDKSEKHLDNLKDKEEKLIPRDRLKLLEEENKAYEDQNKLYEEKVDIAHNEQDRIQKELADLNAGVQFGEDGFVSNYALVYNKLNLQVNDATEEANKKRLKLYNDYNEKIAKKNALLLNANNADQLAQNRLTNAYRAAQKTYNDAVTNYNNRNSSLADAAQRDIEGYEAAAEALKLAANKIFLAAQDRHQGVLRDYNSLTGDQQENYKAILQQEDDLFKNAQTTLSDTLKDIDRNLDKQVEARKKTLLNQQNDLKSVLDQAEQVWSDAEDKYKDDSDKISQRKKDRLKLYKLWEKQLNKEYEKQLKAIEKQLGDLLDRRKNIIDLMKLAEETQNLILELQLKERANDLAKIDNLIAQSKFRVDMSIDTGNFEREFLDFEKKFIKKIAGNDFLGSAKASMKDLMSYINSEQVSLTADQIKMIQEQIDSILKTGTSSKYGDRLTEAKADLEQYMRQQMSDLQAIQEQVDNIKNSYLSAIDDAKSKMDDQINQYERINGLVDHQVKMTQLLYGDKAYDTLDKYYNLQKRNNLDLLNSLKKQQDYWQQKMNQLVVGSDAWKKFKSNLDDVTDKLNSKLLVMIDNLSKQWSNRVDGIIARFNNGMTGGRGLNYLDEQWDQINNYDNQFLDTFESKTGIDEVERLYQSTIDGLTGSPKSQQALNKLMNDQLKLLREKDHLTEYDLERAKASLEVEKARLALEEARDNKTKMRLRRDSQGNYTYQYVADEEKLGDLQAALADAQANLYNTDKEHYKQNLNELYSTYKNYLDQMRSLTEEYNKTQDEEERKRIQGRMDLLKTSTDKLMNGLTLDNKYLLQYLNGSFFDGMGVDTSALTMEEQMEIMQQNIPQMQSGIQDLADTIVGEGGILNATADAMKEINEATSEYDKNVKDMLASAGTSLQTIEQAIDKEGNALDKNIQNAEAFITTNQKLIDECNAQIEAMEKMLDYMDKYLNKVINVLTLVSNLRSAYGTVQGLNGSDLTADKIATEGWGLDTTKGMEYTGNPAIDAAAVKQQIDALMAQYQTFLAQMSIAAFETGGYTGTWGDAEGRLAFLHQGELVLNQLDTSNILSAVQLVRNMANAINGFASGEINSLMNGTTGLLGGISNTEQLDQNVHIEANFPNVTQHTEIEQAFENLVNMASMRASKYRD